MESTRLGAGLCEESRCQWSITRDAPDSDFYYPAGFAGYLKKIRPDTGYFIQFEILNTRMSAKKDQIYFFRPHHILAIYL